MYKTKKYFTLLCLLLTLCSFTAMGQRAGKVKTNRGLPSNYTGLYIGAGYGFIDMDGDYGSRQVGKMTQGYNLLIENKFTTRFILRGSIEKGTLAERLSGQFAYMDFKSEYQSVDVSASYVFSPLTGCTSTIQIRPYANIGIGLLKFDSYADLYDAYGNRYHFWKDGTARIGPESGIDGAFSKILVRDNVFESPLDSLNLYPGVTGIIPAEIGLRFMFSRNIGLYLSARYTITTTDYIDHGVAYRDQLLTDRAFLNHYPDGYYTYGAKLIYRFEDNHVHPKYKKSLRKPLKCRKF